MLYYKFDIEEGNIVKEWYSLSDLRIWLKSNIIKMFVCV
jgi:hypothetical protein